MQPFRTTALLILAILSLAGSAFAGNAQVTKEGFQKQIRDQIVLIQRGSVSKLRVHFTERHRSKITNAMLKKAVKEVSGYTIDELAHKIEISEYKGKRMVKIKMKNGRSLTTFVHVKGKWQADTIWFK